jgi:hypothetical protein
MVLIAFLGRTRPNSDERRNQVDIVTNLVKEMGNVIEPLEETDVSGGIAVRLAAAEITRSASSPDLPYENPSCDSSWP